MPDLDETVVIRPATERQLPRSAGFALHGKRGLLNVEATGLIVGGAKVQSTNFEA